MWRGVVDTLRPFVPLDYGWPPQPPVQLEHVEQPQPNQLKNGKQPVVHVSTNTRLVRHAQLVIVVTSWHSQLQHGEEQELQPHGSYKVKHRDNVPADVST